MINEEVLVTGGAGIVCRTIVRGLADQGADVRVLDRSIDQAHVDEGWRADLRDRADRSTEDVCAAEAVCWALDGVDTVIAPRPIRRIVTGSYMSIYREGLYADADGTLHDHVVREPGASRGRRWDLVGSWGRPLTPVPTPENKRPMLASAHAINRYVQKRMTLTVAQACGIEAALGLPNVFGPGQVLASPYTGVLAILASRLANGRPLLVFEDGRQLGGFDHVEDVARAFVLALAHDRTPGQLFEKSSGEPRTAIEVAAELGEAMGSDVEAGVTQSVASAMSGIAWPTCPPRARWASRRARTSPSGWSTSRGGASTRTPPVMSRMPRQSSRFAVS